MLSLLRFGLILSLIIYNVIFIDDILSIPISDKTDSIIEPTYNAVATLGHSHTNCGIGKKYDEYRGCVPTINCKSFFYYETYS